VLTASLAALAAGSGCVADRPSRNGVFNENQYVRKDFLIRPGNGSTPDPGWMMKATIVATDTPNPFASAGLVVGMESSGETFGSSYVRFEVTQDKLNMLNMREIGPDQQSTGSITAQGTRTPEILNAWPVTNVDLKYRVNLDGEKTNFYEENQELDWQLRQWIKLNFDKNDMSDLAPFGTMVSEFLTKCSDVLSYSATLEPNSFIVDEPNDYWEFKVRVTAPVYYISAPQQTNVNGTSTTTVETTCLDQFGQQGIDFQRMGRQNVTFTLMYSFTRAEPDSAITYQPLVIEEKDHILHKYGPIPVTTPVRDPTTGLLGTRALALRFDPTKEIDFYFAQGYPEQYKAIFNDPNNGVAARTNAILQKAGATAQVVFKNYDQDLKPGERPRQIGDVRYSFIRWISDLDSGGFPTLAATQWVPDLRTGQVISSSINLYDWAWRDYVLARLDYYEQSIGAVDWTTMTACSPGDTLPLKPATVVSTHNASSTLFTKMQQYLQKPVATFGPLGPQDFIVQQDSDFFKAMFTILPYQIFADPATNYYVRPEGGTGNYGAAAQMAAMDGEASFHQLMSTIDHGTAPYTVATGPEGTAQATAFLQQMQQATLAHRDYQYIKHFRYPNRMEDDVNMFSFPLIFARDSRHCVNGQWESRDQYVQDVADSYYAQSLWHEFGHALGLDHNFMASIDRPNFPHYTDAHGNDQIGMYESSLMEYNTTADRVFWSGDPKGNHDWLPYDKGAIGFLYGNANKALPVGQATSAPVATSANTMGVVGSSPSGQSGLAPDGTMVNQANARWNDPYGYDANGNEYQFLFCDAAHEKYTPFCREHDFGTTPSEIVAADIDNYEWQYLWRNFRQYHKFFDFTAYADAPTTFFTEERRFLSSWAYDWSQGELADTLRKLGLKPPKGVPAGTYFDELTNKFNADISMASQMYAAASEAIVQQSSGERPYITRFDPYYGDTIQQGIIVDKLQAIQQFTALWQTDNYDPSQAAGGYLASLSFGDTGYLTVAEQSALSMIGGQYAIFTYAVPLAVLQFAQATHSPYFINGAARPEIKDWVGGYVFYREQDFLDFFRSRAIQNQFVDNGAQCTTLQNCTYDPRVAANPTDPEGQYHSDKYQQFMGPDFRRWIWAYIQDRNVWVAADKDRNVGTYVILFNYTSDIIFGEDDGNTGPAFSNQLPVKYFIDYYNTNN
jgi:hypothetical protein